MTTRGRLTLAGLILLAAVAAGAAVSWYIQKNPPPPGPTPEAVLQGIRQEIEVASRESAAMAAAVKKEVRGIRGKITAEVEALPPDDVARGLNDELALFRGLGARPDRVDGSEAGVLGGDRGRP